MFNSDNVDLEREIEALLIQFLRLKFLDDTVYKYHDDDLTTEIIIATSYPDLERPDLIPNVTMIGTAYSLQETSLAAGFYKKKTDDQGRNVGNLYLSNVNFQSSLSVSTGDINTAKDLANRVSSKLWYSRRMCKNELGLGLNGISKGMVTLKGTAPIKIYGTEINLSGIYTRIYDDTIDNSTPIFLNTVKTKINMKIKV